MCHEVRSHSCWRKNKWRPLLSSTCILTSLACLFLILLQVGHGYGLPHSDEDFTNADLGNCMDYTNNPEANMMPGTYNYEFLADMYGTVPGSATSPEQRNRMLRTRRAPEEEHQELQRIPEEIPEWVMAKWRELDEETENHSHGTERRLGSGWRVLHESEHGEAHEIDIGQGYRIQVHKLLAHE